MRFANHGLGTLVLSLDFELYWGVRDKVSRQDFASRAKFARRAVCQMLQLFEAEQVACTWATVGALMARDEAELRQLWPKVAPRYRNASFDSSAELAQGIEPGLHLAPDLVSRIARTDRQELASHTFSHFLCAEEGALVDAFRADLIAAQTAAKGHGVTLRSIVFPRNQVDDAMLRVCAEQGFVCYRGNANSLGAARRKTSEETLFVRLGRLADAVLPFATKAPADGRLEPGGLINVPASRLFRPAVLASRGASQLALRKVLAEMRSVAENGGLYHLWWHPHNLADESGLAFAQLEEVVRHYCYLRSRFGLKSKTMAEFAEGTQECAA